MSESQPGPIRRVLVGVWNTVNFTRQLVFNLIFLLVLFFVLIAIIASPGAQPLQEKTALVLPLDGQLVEQYTSAPVERVLNQATGDARPEMQLRDLVRAIERARDDKRIDRIVLLTDGFSATGFAAMRDLAAALRDFRASGKQIVAFGTDMEQKQYYLAAQADEVFLDPQGGVLLEGFGRYRMYYREGLQDKLGVDVHLFKVGEYKSAAEPYVLDAASPEAREADLYWMNDVWQRFLADIAQARKLDAAALTAMINELPARVQAAGGDLGKLALDEKLVDGLKTGHELEQLLIERGALDDENNTFRQVDLRAYLQHMARENLGIDSRPQVAVVVAQGEITYGEQPPGTVGGESTSALLRQAREDENVKAVLLRVDSPGGGVFPSEQIRREVELIKAAGKPVVVSMANVAASGGYWISMNADTIYADESTITGSIGIFGLWMTAPRVLDKIGVNTDGVGTTPLAGAFDPTRPLDPNVGALIQSVIDKGYADFTGKVAAARGTTPEQIDVHARGRVWSGAQAKDRGLVDELGGFEAALAATAELAKLEPEKYGVTYIEKPLTAFEQAIVNMGGNSRMRGLLRVLAPTPLLLDRRTLAKAERELAWLDSQSRSPFRAVAHCLCDY
ncbi:signal peptide peptidase SppA [Arenimonas terrae]|jgi:protease-4|uniref:Signal peptide peptidase SppA n=1 Tax=Arenimonas terrae TaxID=2546226 RepID=A0A5C4RP68_9GAMM|nr:signal peptide peptidase SppA [Arenimonas terrae]TNJ33043.1 signal peptide peptidase SppA [Arenimonas terrae]